MKHSRSQSLRSFWPAAGIERLWEQPFQACAIDEDFVKPDGQNSVISFVISKWLLPGLSIPAAGQKDRRLGDENESETDFCINNLKICRHPRTSRRLRSGFRSRLGLIYEIYNSTVLTSLYLLCSGLKASIFLISTSYLAWLFDIFHFIFDRIW